ncbi:hypothetical protein B7R56_20185 [Pseudomonas savastanoi pv. retacarpa]|uniref:Transposase n=10 Tax=Pseudomonas syringae group TaxID=136849 RepID=A0A0P9LEH0_PSECA|nr:MULTISPECIES: hypothetical protein [Pseudomonas syringae group]PPS24101.1 hypothetical protein BVY11_28155 [Pseudomonas amygdali pv. morsprunorum]ARD10040.1 hypothetical protein PSA3335_02430 [Pseudomonas savastanoi pv. savastanoi NCPPB 3335]KAA8701072.1 hypothetical protein F4W70_25570 [Pseudomonas cannabina]KPW67784.1 hypothetical protein ALO81_200392 [Pseudomonas cannabina]KPX79741.1 hypothetical protein ALO64_200115 [Pseudomonas meliae]
MFSNESPSGKITVRSLPPEVLIALNGLAEQHDRSLEAEARQALKAWVKPITEKIEQSSRLAELVLRLSLLKRELEKLYPTRQVSPSRIAEALGWSYAEPVEGWFLGKNEPSIDELTQLSLLFGCQRDWLVHGEGKPYAAVYSRIPEEANAGAKFLLAPTDDGKIPTLHLVRSMSETGQFLFIKQYSDWNVQTFSTPYHISEVIGAGGESSLAALSLVLKALYKAWTGGNAQNNWISGYLVEPDVFSKLLAGDTHPLNVINTVDKSTWWEDFWDISQFKKANYWPGWSSVTERIHNVIERRSSLKEQSNSISMNE